MSTPNIKCQNCGFEIEISESLARPFVEHARNELQSKVIQAELDAKLAKEALLKGETEIAKQRLAIDTLIAEGIATRRPEMEASIKRTLEAELNADIKSKQAENDELRQTLQSSQQAQLDALKAKRSAEEKLRLAEIEIARQVEIQLSPIREQAAKEAQEAQKQKMAEKDLLIERLKDQAEDLKRKAEVGSQQLQGDAAELNLKHVLLANFKRDDIEEIRAGARGADWLQIVVSDGGQRVGSILWESKNAQTFGGDWLAKAKLDQRKDKADIVVIVSNILPRGVENFDCCEDVWVVNPLFVAQFAKALRNDLISTAGARRSAEGRSTNAERVYDYLMGSEFLARIKGIAEPFIAMQSDLEAERRSMTKHWARRQKHIDRVLESAFGLRGDIEALAGHELPELEAVELRSLPATATTETEVD
jgi:hypothetical protein